MKQPWSLLLILALIMTISNSSSEEVFAEKPEAGKQVAQEMKLENGNTIRYYLYLPKGYSSEKKFPLMYFFHGRGERGDTPAQLKKVLVHGPPKLIKQGKEFSCIVVSAQQTTDNPWWTTENLLQFIPQIEKQLSVDQERIYCTGLSMGGFATWTLGNELPNHFAALAPVCGGGEVEWAKNLSQTPLWAFHGAKDSVIPVTRSEEMVEAIKKEGGEVKLTIYPEAFHDSWTKTYENPEFYKWLFTQKRN